MYFVTFRLWDSVPAPIYAAYKEEQKRLSARLAQCRSEAEIYTQTQAIVRHLCQSIDRNLDTGLGDCHLADPRVAEVVHRALGHFDGERYDLAAWCVMPNHVHVVIQPRPDHGLAAILHSWKSFTGTKCNRIIGKRGAFWEREYFDHMLRRQADLRKFERYVLENPKKARLGNWPWVGSNLIG